MNSGPIQPMRCGLNQIGELHACVVQAAYRQELQIGVKRFGLTFSKINISRPDPVFRTVFSFEAYPPQTARRRRRSATPAKAAKPQ
jgi:hypothetical protein